MAIQMRRGAYGNFDDSKLLPGEWAIVLQDDPSAQDGLAAYISFAAGTSKRIATWNDLLDWLNNNKPEVYAAFTTAVDDARNAAESANTNASAASAAADSANKAATSANNAASSANTAASKANTAAGSANSAASSATTATTAANSAADAAKTATTNANNATSAAKTATTNANTATDAAKTATTAANKAADRANTAAGSAESIVSGAVATPQTTGVVYIADTDGTTAGTQYNTACSMAFYENQAAALGDAIDAKADKTEVQGTRDAVAPTEARWAYARNTLFCFDTASVSGTTIKFANATVSGSTVKETGAASRNYAVGEFFYDADGNLNRVTQAVSQGASLVSGTNYTTVSGGVQQYIGTPTYVYATAPSEATVKAAHATPCFVYVVDTASFYYVS